MLEIRVTIIMRYTRRIAPSRRSMYDATKGEMMDDRIKFRENESTKMDVKTR